MVWNGMNGMNGWNWIWMAPLMVTFWVAIGFAIVYLVRGSGANVSALRETPKDILRRRLASGEIEIDEYHRRIEAIHS